MIPFKSSVILIVIIAGVAHFSAGCQSMFSHSKTVKKVFTDSLGQLLFMDAGQDIFLYRNGKTVMTGYDARAMQLIPDRADRLYYVLDSCLYMYNENGFEVQTCKDVQPLDYISFPYGIEADDGEVKLIPIPKKGLEPKSYPFRDSLLGIAESDEALFLIGSRGIGMGGRENAIVEFEFRATDFCLVDQGIWIAAGSAELWAYDFRTLKKLYIPGIDWPTGIVEFKKKGTKLWMKTKSQSLHVYDLERQIITMIASDVDDYLIDDWGVLRYTSGRKIYTEPRFISDRGAILKTNEIKLNGKTAGHEKPLVLNQGDRLSISISSFYPLDGVDISTQFRIDDGRWQPYANEINHVFENTGFYEISTRCAVDGQPFNYMDHYPVRVVSRLERSFWPYLLAVLVLLLLFSLLALRKAMGERKELEGKRRMLEMKLALLQATQRSKQSQMSPHFLFNALNGIKGMVSLGDMDKARQGLGGFARIMRRVLEDSDEDRLPVSDEIKFLEDYLRVEQLVRQKAFSFTIEDFTQEASLPPMMVQPFVENAVIHGVMKAEGEGRISIRFEEKGNYIKVCIEDNGPGFSDEGMKPSGHRSKASEIFTARAQAFDKWKSEKPIVYEALKNADGSYSGTRCILHIAK